MVLIFSNTSEKNYLPFVIYLRPHRKPVIGFDSNYHPLVAFMSITQAKRNNCYNHKSV